MTDSRDLNAIYLAHERDLKSPHLAGLRAVDSAAYGRGRADLLSEIIPVHERHKVAGQVAFMRENWLNNGAEGETVHALCNLVDKLLALVPAEAGDKEE